MTDFTVALRGLPDSLLLDDFQHGFFCCHRYENAFPTLNFDKVFDAIIHVMDNLTMYRARVHRRFSTDLGVSIVAERYAHVLQAAAQARA